MATWERESEGFSTFGFNVAFVTKYSLHFNIAADVSEMVLTHSFAADAYVNDSCSISLINWESSPDAIRMRRLNTHEERMHEMGGMAGGLFPPGTGEPTETDRRKDIRGEKYLKGPSACKCFNFLIICRYFGLK